jgi:hypothetical protein
MKMPVTITLLAAFFLVGCDNKPSQPTVSSSSPSSPTPASAPADYLGGMANAQNRAIKTVDVASLNQAIQLFEVDKGRFPKDLNELVAEKLIARVPEAPYGMKLDYDPTTGKVSVVPKE